MDKLSIMPVKPSTATLNLRLLAARTIDEVTRGHSLADCLDVCLPQVAEGRDRAFIQALCYGICRFYSRLDVILSYLLKKPLKAKDSDLHALLLVGLYQLIGMRVPEYAAVTETVGVAEKLKKPWARGLINAILREYLRNKTAIEERMAANLEAHYAHPIWWIDSLKTAWPLHWQAILEANNAHPPLSLRVNQQRLDRSTYLDKLQAIGCNALKIPETQHGINLDTPLGIEDLPGFSAGEVSVQDGAAQLAVQLLDLAPGLRVLDACAAPGGKLTHLLEEEPKLALVLALDKDQKRINTIKENLLRLQLQATCLCCDASMPKNWWDGQRYDRILLDAPCSASGVVRRHPDIKLLRRKTDIKAYAKKQSELLHALWPLLAPGGLLVYATCSVFPAENVDVINAFLASHSDAVEEKIPASFGLPCEVGRQILPGMHEMDGFYYARIRK